MNTLDSAASAAPGRSAPDPLRRPRFLELDDPLFPSVLWRPRNPRSNKPPAPLPCEVASIPVTATATRGPLWRTLLALPDPTRLPAIGKVEAIVSHYPLDPLPQPGIPQSWLAALASATDLFPPPQPSGQGPAQAPLPVPGATLKVWLRGLGWLHATNGEDGVGGPLTGLIQRHPDTPLNDVPASDIPPATLAMLCRQRGTITATQQPERARDLPRSITALKVIFPDLRHHLQVRSGRRVWHLYRDGSGQWARVTVPARAAPTVMQSDRGGLWELVADWTARWTRCMDPHHPALACVHITTDGQLHLNLSSSHLPGGPPP